jgi:hypothetical protein
MSITITRRSLLRDIAGIGVALPALEIMAPRRAFGGTPAGIPKRFTLSYVGASTGNDSLQSYIEPSKTGANYDIPKSLKPLADMGVQARTSVVTGLMVPWATGGAVPPGGRSVAFHYNTMGPNVAGTKAGAGGNPRNGTPLGPTADQIVADAIAGTTVQRVLTYSVQPADYEGGGTTSSALRQSYRNIGGKLTSVDPTSSPRVAYQSLFANFSPTDPGQVAKAKALLAQRKSVLDFVAGDTQALMNRLGQADKIRMQQHFDQIRGLEQRLDTVAPVGQTCKLLPDPGADPPVGNISTNGYSGEDHRGDLMSDFIAMAFACDMSRVASFMLASLKCLMLAYPVTQWKNDIHAISHQSGPGDIGDTVAYFVLQFARLVKKLQAIPEVDGSTVLDHSACILLFEGGHGHDPESGGTGAHSTENMTVLIAGGAGGLKAGQHIVAQGKHPANVVISGMHAVGVDAPLGDVSGFLPALFA